MKYIIYFPFITVIMLVSLFIKQSHSISHNSRKLYVPSFHNVQQNRQSIYNNYVPSKNGKVHSNSLVTQYIKRDIKASRDNSSEHIISLLLAALVEKSLTENIEREYAINFNRQVELTKLGKAISRQLQSLKKKRRKKLKQEKIVKNIRKLMKFKFITLMYALEDYMMRSETLRKDVLNLISKNKHVNDDKTNEFVCGFVEEDENARNVLIKISNILFIAEFRNNEYLLIISESFDKMLYFDYFSEKQDEESSEEPTKQNRKPSKKPIKQHKETSVRDYIESVRFVDRDDIGSIDDANEGSSNDVKEDESSDIIDVKVDESEKIAYKPSKIIHILTKIMPRSWQIAVNSDTFDECMNSLNITMGVVGYEETIETDTNNDSFDKE